jgi:hypothetical protein
VPENLVTTVDVSSENSKAPRSIRMDIIKTDQFKKSTVPTIYG